MTCAGRAAHDICREGSPLHVPAGQPLTVLCCGCLAVGSVPPCAYSLPHACLFCTCCLELHCLLFHLGLSCAAVSSTWSWAAAPVRAPPSPFTAQLHSLPLGQDPATRTSLPPPHTLPHAPPCLPLTPCHTHLPASPSHPADMYKDGSSWRYNFLYMDVEAPVPQQVGGGCVRDGQWAACVCVGGGHPPVVLTSNTITTVQQVGGRAEGRQCCLQARAAGPLGENCWQRCARMLGLRPAPRQWWRAAGPGTRARL